MHLKSPVGRELGWDLDPQDLRHTQCLQLLSSFAVIGHKEWKDTEEQIQPP